LLSVNEIFYSIQGESTFSGMPCVFIRLSGCNLRCHYCDTAYAYSKGRSMSVNQIIEQVSVYECPLVEITGGEPLLQKKTPRLAERLTALGYRVLVETNGTQNIDPLKDHAVCIMDIKCPGSGEHEKTDWSNIQKLHEHDQVKFVIGSRVDYEWAKEIVRKYRLQEKVEILFSPARPSMTNRELAELILQDRLHVRLQVQLHKWIWPHETEGR